MKENRLIVAGISGAISGAMVEVCLAAVLLYAIGDIYPPGFSTPSFTADVAISAAIEGAVAGLVAGAIAGLVGRWAWLLVIAAAAAGFLSVALCLLGAAAGGLVALIVLEIQQVLSRQTA